MTIDKLINPLNQAAGVVCITVLMALETVPAEAGLAIFGALVGVSAGTVSSAISTVMHTTPAAWLSGLMSLSSVILVFAFQSVTC